MNVLTSKDIDKVKYFMDNLHASDANFEEKVLHSFMELFGFSQSIFWVCQEDNHLVFDPTRLNIDREPMEQYTNHFYKKDPIIPVRNFATLHTNQQRVINLDNLISEKQFKKTEFYNDFYRIFDFYHNIGLHLVHNNRLVGYIDFCFPENEMDINANDFIALELIARALSHKTAEHLLHEQKLEKASQANEDLSPREIEVFKLLIQGYTNKRIAESLFISVNTVKKHVRNIFIKYNVSNRSKLLYKVKFKKR